jgi:hypothetical protein
MAAPPKSAGASPAQRGKDRVHIAVKLLRRVRLRVQLHPVALRLGHIQDVVDEAQQEFGGGVDLGQTVRRLGRIVLFAAR